MKKLLAISFIAMTAVSAANAEIASKAYVDQQDDAVEAIIGALTDLDTTAKDSVVAAINEVNTAVGNVDFSMKADAAEDLTGATKTKITYNNQGIVTAGADLEETDIPSLHLAKVTDVTATASEVNALHEAGAVKADFEKLHAITADASELNVLDGVTASTAELNILDGVTATTTEINQLAGKTLGNAAEATVATSIAENGTGLATAGQVYTAVAGATSAIDNLDATAAAIKGEQTGNVVVGVAQTDGAVSATFGNAVSTVNAATGGGNVVSGVAMNSDGQSIDVTTVKAAMEPATWASDENGTYTLTASKSGDVITYHWELIQRASSGNGGSGNGN